MLWTEIRKWAKERGYNTIKDKEDGKYYWAKMDSDHPNDSGVATSVSKLATAIYNHITNNAWIDHQNQFIKNQEPEKFSVSDYPKG